MSEGGGGGRGGGGERERWTSKPNVHLKLMCNDHEVVYMYMYVEGRQQVNIGIINCRPKLSLMKEEETQLEWP